MTEEMEKWGTKGKKAGEICMGWAPGQRVSLGSGDRTLLNLRLKQRY